MVFKLDTTGKETVLHTFSGPDGLQVDAGLVRDAKGNLYGTTVGGGASGNGVVFRLMFKLTSCDEDHFDPRAATRKAATGSMSVMAILRQLLDASLEGRH